LDSFARIKIEIKMLRLKLITSTTILLLFVSSCRNETEIKWEKTLKVHDVVMLKMQETGDMEAKLNQLISRAKLDSSTVLFSKIDTLQDAYKQLEVVDEEMMDWMASIQAPKSGDDKDSILLYLDQEEKAIIEVGVHMDNAVNHAEALIKSLEK
jgi:hypothetical protein